MLDKAEFDIFSKLLLFIVYICSQGRSVPEKNGTTERS